jgi:hypothetical protein
MFLIPLREGSFRLAIFFPISVEKWAVRGYGGWRSDMNAIRCSPLFAKWIYARGVPASPRLAPIFGVASMPELRSSGANQTDGTHLTA